MEINLETLERRPRDHSEGTPQGKRQRVVIYLRVSTAEQVENTSLDTQRKRCTEKAREMGWEIVEIYSDEGVSGSLYQTRAGIQAALGRIEAGEAEVLLSYRLDRTSRNLLNTLDIQRRIERAKGFLAFCNTGLIANSNQARLLFNITGALDEFERGRIRDRTWDGIYALLSEGRLPSAGNVQYGLKAVRKVDIIKELFDEEEQGHIYVDTEKAGWVVDMYAHLLEHRNPSKLARHLNAIGAPKPGKGKGQRWYATSVKRILSHPAYIGKYPWGKRESWQNDGSLDAADPFEKPKKRIVRARPEEEWHWISCPPIIDEETWLKAQEILAGDPNDKRAASAAPQGAHMLSGLVRCPHCGRRMSINRLKSAKGATKRYYRCPSVNCSRGGKGYYRLNKADRLEGLVVEGLRQLSERPHLIRDAVEAAHKAQRANTTEAVSERERLEAELKELGAQAVDTVNNQLGAQRLGLDPAPYFTILKGIQDKQEQIKERLLELGGTRKSARPKADAGETVEAIAAGIQAVLSCLVAPDEEFSVLEKRRIVQAIVAELVATPGGAVFTLRDGVATLVQVEEGTDEVAGRLEVTVLDGSEVAHIPGDTPVAGGGGSVSNRLGYDTLPPISVQLLPLAA
jgi:site-specific DNA recombinase